MYKDKSFLAIIPARSGSKGIKNKNIKLLNGKPLIQYTIDAAIESKIFNEIYVSTDSEEYASVAKKCGADLPFLRPIEIAQDNSNANEYIIHAINEYKKLGKNFDYFVLLQPTSPLRTSSDILYAVDILISEHLDSVVSVCEAEHSPYVYNILPKNKNLYEFVLKENNKNRQEVGKYYRINGAIYIMDCNKYLKTNNFYGINSKAYIMEQQNSVDIDSELDFKFAEFLMNNKLEVCKCQ